MHQPSKHTLAEPSPRDRSYEAGALDFGQMADRLVRATSFVDLARAYHAAVDRLLSFPMHAVYLFDAETGLTTDVSCVNVSDLFLARYERLGRDADPVFRSAVEHKAPAYNLDLMTPEEWVETECYRSVARIHQIRHVVEIPIVIENEIAGMLNVGCEDPTRSILPGEINLTSAIARIMGTVIAAQRARERRARETMQLRVALDASASAIVVFDPSEAQPMPNDAARVLLEHIEGGEDILYRVVARPANAGDDFVQSVDVRLCDGSSVVLRAHTRLMPEQRDVVISVLNLEGGCPTLAGPSWSALSPREREVAQLVVNGFTDREIAARLVLSPHTVRQHVKRIYRKVGVRSRVELARLVHNDGQI